MKTELSEGDMRSLARKRMHQIFAPLDAEERLPRELLLDGRRFRSVGRRELAGLLWLPALLLCLTAVGRLGGGAPVAVGTAAALLGALGLLAKSGPKSDKG